jgi:hypothetical protein
VLTANAGRSDYGDDIFYIPVSPPRV